MQTTSLKSRAFAAAAAICSFALAPAAFADESKLVLPDLEMVKFLGMTGRMLLMLGLSHGAALLIAAGSVYTELFERVTHLATYLLMGLTGAFFMVFWLPTEFQRAALWIPTVHCFELIRHGQYGTRVPTYYDISYVAGWIAGLNLFGMAALRRARLHLVV